jgi:hypothetical protein
MGVSLSYRSRGVISEKHVALIMEDAKKLEESRRWWAEPIFFFPPDFGESPQKKGMWAMIMKVTDSVLGLSGAIMEGDTKFSIPGGYSGDNGDFVDVDAEENEIMGYFDVRAILTFLSTWSKVTSVGWQICCVGEPCGVIKEDGTMDAQLGEFVDSFLRHSPFSLADPALPNLIAEIDRKYASRG